jgi:hypothetical protein
MIYVRKCFMKSQNVPPVCILLFHAHTLSPMNLYKVSSINIPFKNPDHSFARILSLCNDSLYTQLSQIFLRMTSVIIFACNWKCKILHLFYKSFNFEYLNHSEKYPATTDCYFIITGRPQS